jgi:hypothetical protein
MIIVDMPLLSKEGKGKRGEDDDECSAYPTVRQNRMIINTITSQIFSFSFSLLYCTLILQQQPQYCRFKNLHLNDQD